MNVVDMRIAPVVLCSCSALALGALGFARSPEQWLAVALAALVPPALALQVSREPTYATLPEVQRLMR